MSRSYYVRSRTFDYPLRVPEVVRWWDAPNMKLPDGNFITAWYDRIAKDQAVEATSVQTYDIDAYNNKPGVVFAAAADGAAQRFLCGYGNVHSNTNGMMIFVAGKTTGTPRFIISKKGTSSGTYFWSFGAVSAGAFEDKTTHPAAPAEWRWNSDATRDWLVGTWGIVAYTWTPTAAPVIYLNKTACDTEDVPTAVNSIDDDDGNDQKINIGGLITGAGSPFQGTIGDIIILNSHSAALRNAMFDWLGARWNIPMP